MECRHLDGNRHNNRASNLAWGTRRENVQDTHKHGFGNSGARNGQAKLSLELVLEIRQWRAAGVRVMDLGRGFGVSCAHMSQIVRGHHWKFDTIEREDEETEG